MLPLRRDGAAGALIPRNSLMGRLLVRDNSGTSNSSQGTTAAIVVSFDPIWPSGAPAKLSLGVHLTHNRHRRLDYRIHNPKGKTGEKELSGLHSR